MGEGEWELCCWETVVGMREPYLPNLPKAIEEVLGKLRFSHLDALLP